MTHNTNPHTEHSGQFPSPDVNAHDFDVSHEDSVLDETSEDSRDIFDDMHQTAQHSGQLPHGVPTGAQIAAMAAAQRAAVAAQAAQANAIVVATATVNAHNQNIPAVTGQYGAPPLVAAGLHIPPHGPLAHADGERCRAMARTAGLVCAGTIAAGGLGGIVALGLYLGGIIGAAGPDVPNVVIPDMNNPGGGQSGKTPTPDEKTLAMWLLMDDAKFFALFRDRIDKDPDGFNLVNTSYVASSLSVLYDKMFPQTSYPVYASNVVPDSQIDSDFSALKSGPNGVTLLGIFDVSANYPDPAVVMATPAVAAFKRGIRLNYLARMYAKTLKESMAAKAAAPTGTTIPAGTTTNPTGNAMRRGHAAPLVAATPMDTTPTDGPTAAATDAGAKPPSGGYA